MNKLNQSIVLKRNIFILGLITLFLSCSTTKKRGDLTNFGKLYHNTTSQYNGYFNATELMKESLLILEEGNEDNYDDLLNVYAFQSDNPEAVYSQLDKAIEKVSTVVTLHRQSKWVDDCYLLLGKAQFYKQDYESAEETFRFFQEEFNAYNAYPDKSLGKAKPTTKQEKKREQEIKRAEREEEKEVQKEEREEQRKIQAEKKEADKKARDDARKAREEKKKQEDKLKEQIRKLKDNLKKAEKRRKDKERKEKEKARKERKRLPKKDPNKDYRSAKEIEIAGKIEAKEQELAILKNQDLEPKEEEEKEDPATEAETTDDQETSQEDKPKEEEEKKDEEPEEEEEEVKKDYSKPTPPIGVFKHKTAYHEGLLWLARTFAERDNAFSSEYILKSLQAEPGLYGSVEKEIPVSYAHLYIKEKNYPKAIKALDEAIEMAGDKNTKARYAFIQGQLYEKINETTNALASYERAADFKPKFKMRFHSNLKKITLGHRGAKMSSESALSKLGKMLKEDKYLEYDSEIYMAIGEIHLSDGNQDEAIVNFQSATGSDYASANKKSELYLKLASMFYSKEEYLQSSLYYDSTLQVIDKKHTKFDEVNRRAKNLQSIASNLQQIELQDSLMALSTLSPEEQREKAIEIIKQRREEGQTGPSLNTNPGLQKRGGLVRKVGAKSNFFAYNQIAVAQGQREFKRKYGNRTLEDNWRRSDRPDATLNFDELAAEDDVEEVIEESEITEVIAEFPNSESRKKIVLDKKAMAIFNLGIAYRNDIQDYEKSISTFEDLLAIFPSFEQKSDVYYYMYLNYLDLNDASTADSYALKLRNEFPESDFAKMLFDESFINAFKAEQNKTEIAYKATYAMFEQGDYANTKLQIDSLSKDLDKKHPYAPKFELLKAMTIGNLEGKEAYIVALKSMTKKFPNTPEQVRATEILRFLDGKGDAFTSSLLDKEALEAFKMEPKKLHYGVVIVYNLKDKATQEAKISISNYNKEFFKLDRLKVTSVVLNKDDKTQILLVRKFKNKSEADKYYRAVSKNEDKFLDSSIKREFFMITQRNYRELLKQKSPVGYMSFFEENYK